VKVDALDGVKHVDFSLLKERKALLALGRRDRGEAKCVEVSVELPSGMVRLRVVGSTISVAATGPLPPVAVTDLEDAFYLFMRGDDEGFRGALLNLLRRGELLSLEADVSVEEQR